MGHTGPRRLSRGSQQPNDPKLPNSTAEAKIHRTQVTEMVLVPPWALLKCKRSVKRKICCPGQVWTHIGLTNQALPDWNFLFPLAPFTFLNFLIWLSSDHTPWIRINMYTLPDPYSLNLVQVFFGETDTSCVSGFSCLAAWQINPLFL